MQDSYQLQKELCVILLQSFWIFIKIIFSLVFSYLVFISFCYYIYRENWRILIIPSILYFLWLIFHKYFSHPIRQIGFLVLLYWIGLFDLGIHLPTKTLLKDISKDTYPPVVSVQTDKGSYVLIRSISRGAIVQNEKEIAFFQWDRVESLHQPLSSSVLIYFGERVATHQ